MSDAQARTKKPYSEWFPEWHGLHYLPQNADSLLDIGCNVGQLLEQVAEMGISELYGMDINPNAIAKAEKRLAQRHKCRLFHGSADKIPLPDSSVDVVTCFEVLEHIPERLRSNVLCEAARVLVPGGRLILTVPAAGLFAWLDPANMRLRFPRLFAMAAALAGGAGREAGYENQKHGIVFHHHFELTELRRLLDQAFQISTARFRGVLLVPIAACLQFPFYRRNQHDHPVLNWLKRVEEFDLSFRVPEWLGYDLILVASRLPETHSEAEAAE